RVLRGVHRRHTLAAAGTFTGFARPVLLAWASDDRLFPLPLAHRLAAALPDARVEPVPGSFTFRPEDQPAALADPIVRVAAATGATPAARLSGGASERSGRSRNEDGRGGSSRRSEAAALPR